MGCLDTDVDAVEFQMVERFFSSSTDLGVMSVTRANIPKDTM